MRFLLFFLNRAVAGMRAPLAHRGGCHFLIAVSRIQSFLDQNAFYEHIFKFFTALFPQATENSAKLFIVA